METACNPIVTKPKPKVEPPKDENKEEAKKEEGDTATTTTAEDTPPAAAGGGGASGATGEGEGEKMEEDVKQPTNQGEQGKDEDMDLD